MHQMGPQFGNCQVETDSPVESPGDKLAKDLAALKEMVEQQQLMMNALLQSTMGPTRGDRARPPSENREVGVGRMLGNLQIRLVWLNLDH